MAKQGSECGMEGEEIEGGKGGKPVAQLSPSTERTGSKALSQKHFTKTNVQYTLTKVKSTYSTN